MLCLIYGLFQLKAPEPSVLPCYLLLFFYLQCHALLFPGHSSVRACCNQLALGKKIAPLESLGMYSNLPEHRQSIFHLLKVLAVAASSTWKRPRLRCSTLIHWSTSTMADMCHSLAFWPFWSSHLFGHTLLVQHTILLPQDNESAPTMMNEIYLLSQLASGGLFLGLLPCQTWKQEQKSFKASTCRL